MKVIMNAKVREHAKSLIMVTNFVEEVVGAQL